MTPETPSTPQHSYRPDIDGLRALSILLVVAFHAGIDGLSGGFVGVDVFFVLSGYLITGLLVAEHRRSGRIALSEFYGRRARRLLPMAFITIASTALAGWWLVAPLRRTELIEDARAASLYVANWRFAGQATAYSDVEVSDGLLVHFWSLAIEEQFYVVWPALIVAVGVISGRWFPGSFRRGLVGLLTALISLSFAYSVMAAREGPDAYYSTLARVWELGAGALLALLVPVLPRLSRLLAEALAVAGVAMICTAALVYDSATPFPGLAAAVPVVGCALLVATGGGGNTTMSWLLSRRPMQYLGRLSYSWYLLHWPVIGLCLLWAERRGLPWSRSWVVAVAVALSLVMSALSNHFIEQPVRLSRALSVRPSRSLALGALLTLVPVVMGHAALAARDSPQVVSAPAPTASSSGAAGSTDATAQSETTVVAAGVDAMTPEEAAADEVSAYPDDCHSGFEEIDVGTTCRFGAADAHITVALVGDSHAQHWLPALDRAGRERGWSVLAWTKSACTVIDVDLVNTTLERPYSECDEWRTEIARQLAARGRIDLIIIADSYRYGGTLLGSNGEDVDDLAELALWQDAARSTLSDYLEISDRVVLLRDTPWAASDVPECLSLDVTAPERCAFPVAGHARLDEQYVRAELAAADRLTNARPGSVAAIDMTDAVCGTDPCQVVTPSGMIKYRDRHHLTTTFSTSLADALAARLDPFIGTGSRIDRDPADSPDGSAHQLDMSGSLQPSGGLHDDA